MAEKRRSDTSSAGQAVNKRRQASGEEAALNIACTQAKAALRASPDDTALKSTYETAKEVFKVFQREKLEQGREKQTAPSTDDTWTCDVCDVTIAVRADGLAQQQHLSGKMHAKRLKRTTASASAPAVEPAAEPTPFACKICACSVPAKMRDAHVEGKTHRERIMQLCEVSVLLKRGDWVCCQRRPKHHQDAMAHNYAANQTCCRGNCLMSREEGLEFEEIMHITKRAKKGL